MDLFPGGGEMILRMVLSILLGGLVGLEREWHGKPAGLRTHMLVCLGSATFTLVMLELFDEIAAAGAASARIDPLRLIQGLIGGIGFLGAGSIIRSGGSVEGLTTAGSLWLTGAIGLAVGGGHYPLAGAAVALALVVLVVAGRLDRALARRRPRQPEDGKRPDGGAGDPFA